MASGSSTIANAFLVVWFWFWPFKSNLLQRVRWEFGFLWILFLLMVVEEFPTGRKRVDSGVTWHLDVGSILCAIKGYGK